MIVRSLPSAVVALVALLPMVALSGCDGGPEQYSYQSDVYSPKTVTLKDTTTGEELLKVDVPPGQQLNLKFESTKTEAEKAGSETLRWNVTPWGDTSLVASSVVKVPPASSRRIDITLRPSPEPRPLPSK